MPNTASGSVVESQLSPASGQSSVTRSLNRQVVLEEDEYTAALSHIIARDFFPSLKYFDAANNYLNTATHSNAPSLLNSSIRNPQESTTPSTARRVQHSLQTPSQTPYGNDPSDTPYINIDRPKKRPRYDVNMTLDNFQARYTSEDNSSFIDIMEDENRLRKAKWAWAWDAQKRVEAQTKKMIEEREKLLIEPASTAYGVKEKLKIEAPVILGQITGGETDLASVAVESDTSNKDDPVTIADKGDDSSQPVDVMAKKVDDRSAKVDSWKFKVREVTKLLYTLIALMQFICRLEILSCFLLMWTHRHTILLQ